MEKVNKMKDVVRKSLQFSKMSKSFAPKSPKTSARIVISPTLSCGQIRTVLFSGFGSFCLFFSHHFKPANKQSQTEYQPASYRYVEKINACGSSVAELSIINNARILNPNIKPSKKFSNKLTGSSRLSNHYLHFCWLQ